MSHLYLIKMFNLFELTTLQLVKEYIFLQLNHSLFLFEQTRFEHNLDVSIQDSETSSLT